MRRRRRRERGVIALELILVTIFVLVIIWWGIDYFRISYRQRLTALGESQTKAWALSYPNGPQCFVDSPVIGGPTPPGVSTIPSDLRALWDGWGVSSLFKMGYHTDQSAYELSADAQPEPRTDDLRMTRGRTFLPCNEWVAPPGVDDDVYTPLHEELMPH